MSWITSTGLLACSFEWTSWFYDHPSAWTVTVTPRSDQRGWQPLSGGPWSFTVTVPTTTTATDTPGVTTTDVPVELAPTTTGVPVMIATTVTDAPTAAATTVSVAAGVPTSGSDATFGPSPSPTVPRALPLLRRPLPPVTATVL